jgi:hypothetical protein
MYVSDRKNCINISFTFDKNKVAEKALLDSGATNNFIDQRTVNRLHISMRRLTKPRILYNVDKTKNKSRRITHYVDLEITRGTQIRVQRFYVTNLGTNRFILGFPWLYEFNPNIDWRRHTANGLPLHLCYIFLYPYHMLSQLGTWACIWLLPHAAKGTSLSHLFLTYYWTLSGSHDLTVMWYVISCDSKCHLMWHVTVRPDYLRKADYFTVW